jgi:hypothetical protein
MSFDLNASRDWSKVGIASASDPSTYPSSTGVFASAKAAMEADSWSNDVYAISSVEQSTQQIASGGNGHLTYNIRSGRLLYNANGHLMYNPNADYRTICRCSCLADSYDTSAHAGETCSQIRLYIVCPGAFAGNYGFTFNTSSSETPNSAWSWVTSGRQTFYSSSPYTGYVTFSTSITLDNWLWVITSFDPYDDPTVPSPPGLTGYYFGASNTIRIN